MKQGFALLFRCCLCCTFYSVQNAVEAKACDCSYESCNLSKKNHICHENLILNTSEDLHLEILSEIFWRHCSWRPPSSILNDLRQHNDYPVPWLVNVSLEECTTSSLPLASAELWLRHSDVVVLADSTRDKVEDDLNRACNKQGSSTACIVFVQTEAIWMDNIGAGLLLHSIQRPFLLITSSNSDVCAPYEYYPLTSLYPAVEYLLRSPLLIRWYSKNPCIFSGHVSGKLVALPIGPKFQFNTTLLQGYDKARVKRAIHAAGGHDPRGLFLSGSKARRVCGGMWVPNTDRPHYLANTGLRRVVAAAMAQLSSAPPDGGYVLDSGLRPYAAYIELLAGSAFALAPPGAGLDTHRTWEALALGVIPVVFRGPLAPLFRRLPVVAIARPSELLDAPFAAWRAALLPAAADFDWARVTAFPW
jgi:hypothetical protein